MFEVCLIQVRPNSTDSDVCECRLSRTIQDCQRLFIALN